MEVEGLYESFEIPPVAKYLILAGDIGKLVQRDRFFVFLKAHASKFSHIFLVLGNHEFYGVTRDEGLEIAQWLENQLHGKLTVMNRIRVDVSQKVTVLGCTLHSHINPDHFEEIGRVLSDFKMIKSWTPAAHNDEHNHDVTWLKEQVSSIPQNRRIIICTHHAPIVRGSCNSPHENSVTASAFATELFTREARWRKGTVWIYGHTHQNGILRRKGVTIVSNQRGYFGTGEKNRIARNEFRRDFTINV